jgi:replicative DNA helicase
MSYSSYWKPQKSAYAEAFEYLKGRRDGTIRSFKTPWPKMNDAGVDGIEWQSLVVIGGRPGSGKTLVKDQIVREAAKNNPGETMRVLEFSLEMVSRVSKIRECSSVIGKPYKYICSAQRDAQGKRVIISDEDLLKIKSHMQDRMDINKYPVDIIERAPDPETFEKIIEEYMEEYATEHEGKKKYVNTLITIDHSILLRQGKGHASRTDMLYELGERITKLKRIYPIIFIVLSQLGRQTENAERNENGKHGNYVLESDLFGGDALFQHADMVIGMNCPYKKSIRFYGPEKYIINDDTEFVWHYLKCRAGDTRITFMKGHFDKMEIREMANPPGRQKSVKP